MIPRVVNIAINDDTNSKPFKITSTSSLALLLFLILFREYMTEVITIPKIKTILEFVNKLVNFA